MQALASAAGIQGVDERAFVLSWLFRRGIASIWKSSDSAHVGRNLAAVAHASRIPQDAFDDLSAFGTPDVVDMVGGCDEYAQALRSLCSVGRAGVAGTDD